MGAAEIEQVGNLMVSFETFSGSGYDDDLSVPVDFQYLSLNGFVFLDDLLGVEFSGSESYRFYYPNAN